MKKCKCKHEWRQVNSKYNVGYYTFYCIHCLKLKDVEYNNEKNY